MRIQKHTTLNTIFNVIKSTTREITFATTSTVVVMLKRTDNNTYLHLPSVADIPAMGYVVGNLLRLNKDYKPVDAEETILRDGSGIIIGYDIIKCGMGLAISQGFGDCAFKDDSSLPLKIQHSILNSYVPDYDINSDSDLVITASDAIGNVFGESAFRNLKNCGDRCNPM